MTMKPAGKKPEKKFNDFCNIIHQVPKRYEETALLAAYVDWSCIVAKSGFLGRPAMYMSKNWMCSLWSWDHCFNAVALAHENPEAAWDQWILPFDHQDSTGLIPDNVCNSKGGLELLQTSGSGLGAVQNDAGNETERGAAGGGL